MFESVLIWVFWISLLLGVYVYFIYPLILFLLSAIFGKNPSTEYTIAPRTVLLIACYNEAGEIEKRLANLLSLDFPFEKLKILVLSDGSSDATVQIARDFALAHPEVPVTVLDFKENRGKCSTLLRGVNWVKENWPETEILAFTDANSHWRPDSLKKLLAPFADEKVGSVAGLFVYDNPDKLVSGEMEGLYWKYETLIKRLSGRLGTLPGGAGAIFALRLMAYEPLSEFRGDDFELPVMAIIKGFRSVFIEDALSFEPPSPDLMTEFRRKKRIVGIMVPSGFALFGKALFKGRSLLAFQLLSHKILRWLVPFFMIAILLCSALLWNTGLTWQIAFIVQIVFYILALAGWVFENNGKITPKVFRLPFYFTMVNFAGLIGFLQAIGGKPVKWERNR